MRYDSENIESKLIPYLEGVLNAKERREVDEAIGQDGDLAREMSELREVILELRQGFASGMKPPQEELSVDDVVELGFNIGTIDGLPGTSEQKARLFCSDKALEEYALLRALAEELQRTSIDRENVPDMPANLRNEFLRLKSAPRAPKLLPFVRKLSPAPAWKRASGMLDRINPKPLMASAAALMFLSFGVHLYNQPTRSSRGESETLAGAANQEYFADNDDSAGKRSASSSEVAAAEPPPGETSGVAVFTSDDRSLLKEQAEKLLAKKLRYTVTQDRILVADKDLDEARGILWDDAEGKAVAVASESTEKSQIKQDATGETDSKFDNYKENGPVATVDVEQALEDATDSGKSGPAEVTYYTPSRSAAPAKPRPPTVASAGSATRSAGSALPAYRAAPSSTSQSNGRKGSAGALSGYSSSSSSAVKNPAPEAKSKDILEGAPAPTRVEPTTDGASAAVSEERRQQLKEMALGVDRPGSSGGRGSPGDEDGLREENAPKPSTVVLSRARVAAAAPPPRAASSPVANVVSASSSMADASKKAEAEVSAPIPQAPSRVASIEQNRSGAARRLGVDLSIESQGEHVTVYVRSKKQRSKAELDELRRAVRQELGLSESDTIILR